MAQIIRRGIAAPEVREMVERIVRDLPQKDYGGEIEAVHAFVRDRVRYTLDPVGVELLQEAARVLRERMADCDDKTICVCALLGAIGHPTRLIAIGPTSRSFSHVFAQVRDRRIKDPTDPKAWKDLECTEPWPAGKGARWNGMMIENVGGGEFMSVLESGELNGLEGWGSFKKKLGINKLKTRNFAKASVKSQIFLAMPTKKTAKKAVTAIQKSKLAQAQLAIAAAVAAPQVAGKMIAGQLVKQATGEAEPAQAQYVDEGASQAAPVAPQAAPAQSNAGKVLTWTAAGLMGAKLISLVV